jgi:hypothetical protein
MKSLEAASVGTGCDAPVSVRQFCGQAVFAARLRSRETATPAMTIRIVTVFGGTGFLGRRIVEHLRKGEISVRVASRHPERSLPFRARRSRPKTSDSSATGGDQAPGPCFGHRLQSSLAVTLHSQTWRKLLVQRMQTAGMPFEKRKANCLTYSGVTYDQWEYDRHELLNIN